MSNQTLGQPGRIVAICLWVVLFTTLGSSVAQTASSGPPAYLDPAQPVNVRVDDLVSRMTLEEKASQLVNQSRGTIRQGGCR
jgi:beta-glucosidase